MQIFATSQRVKGSLTDIIQTQRRPVEGFSAAPRAKWSATRIAGKGCFITVKTVTMQRVWRATLRNLQPESPSQSLKSADTCLMAYTPMAPQKIANPTSSALAGSRQSTAARHPLFSIRLKKLVCPTRSTIAQNQRDLRSCAREKPTDSTLTRGSAAIIS